MKRLNIFIGAAALAAVLMTAATNINAQENGNRDEYGNIVRGPYETNRFGDNWFIGAGGGINIFINEGYDIKVAPSLDINLGKWFTPSVGMRIGYQGLNSQVWSDNASTLGPTLDSDKGQYLQKFGYMYIHGDFLWNMSNALSGYKETRFWDFVPYLHAGFYRAYGTDNISYSNNELAAGAGLLHNLRLTERLDLIVDMRATFVNGRVHEASGLAIIPSVTMGLAVDIGWPGFVRTASVLGAVEAANAEKAAILETSILALEAANVALEEDNMNLLKTNKEMKKKMDSMKNVEKADMKEFFNKLGGMTLYFDIGKAVLGEKEMKHLDFYAKNIISEAADKADIYITVMGSADSNTGTQARNKHLSEARGKYIYDILTGKYGISPERLTVKSEVVKAASNPTLSRAVIISF